MGRNGRAPPRPPHPAWPTPPPPPPSAHAPLFPATRPTILSVGTLEGRKNHIALLDACEQLWSDAQHPLDFELHLIGAVQRQTGRSALERIAALQSAGRPIRYDGPVDDATLEQAYARCAFTVYPSLMEGFGLPVLESVHRHRPCICRTQGALAEVAAGGGTLGIQNPDSTALALAIRRLLTDAAMLARLADEARQRPVRTWTDYTRDLLAWLPAIQRRATIPVD